MEGDMERLRLDPPHKAAPYFPSAGSYITPPTEVHDSFSSDEGSPAQSKQPQYKLPPINHHTPPTSPAFTPLPPISDTATGFTSHDLPLFPDGSARRATSQPPLFPPTESQTTVTASPPKPQPVEPSSTFAQILGIKNGADALNYWKKCYAELRDIRKANLPLPLRETRSTARDSFDRQQLTRLTRPAGVTKPAPKSPRVTKSKAAASTSPVVPAKTSHQRQRSTPTVRTYRASVDRASPSEEGKSKNKRAAPSKALDPRPWQDIPDYAPPTSTLSNTVVLKTAWHGNNLDLSNDPDRDHLHPQELTIASALRFTCENYMKNKRKIFEGKLEALREDKTYTKTRAQNKCGIDVNKASRLWEAFNGVGWFEQEWFEQWL